MVFSGTQRISISSGPTDIQSTSPPWANRRGWSYPVKMPRRRPAREADAEYHGILVQEQAEWLRSPVQDAALRELPAAQSRGIGLDGAQWIIEMAKGGYYHVIARWSPSADDPRFFEGFGRGEWIRTTDLLVPNHQPTYYQRLSGCTTVLRRVAIGRESSKASGLSGLPDCRTGNSE